MSSVLAFSVVFVYVLLVTALSRTLDQHASVTRTIHLVQEMPMVNCAVVSDNY